MILTERIRNLKDNGYTKIGQGRSSLVYSKGSLVVKLVDERDEAQIKYLTSNQLPRFVGQHYPVYTCSNTYREGYDLRDSSKATRFLEFYGRKLNKPPKTYRGVSWKYFMDTMRNYAKNGSYSRHLDSSVCIALDTLVNYANRNKYLLDLSSSNILFDGDELIVHDPLFTI